MMRRCISFAAVIVVLVATAVQLAAQGDPYEARRLQMVKQDIEGRGIKDPLVLNAMRKVPRHLLVEESLRSRAYDDNPLPIGEGQTISQPYIVAFMTETLRLAGGERVLEVGTGSGYQAAVLAEIVKDVYTIEIVPGLYSRTRERLLQLGYRNVHTRLGDGYAGWPEHAPFDAVIMTAAAERIPAPLFEQLAEGGRMVMPLGSTPLYQKLTLITKKSGKPVIKELLPVRFVPLTGEGQKK